MTKFEVSTQELKAALKFANAATSKDGTRPVLKCVELKLYKSEIRISGADGYILYSHRVAVQVVERDDDSCDTMLLDRTDVATIVKNLTKIERDAKRDNDRTPLTVCINPGTNQNVLSYWLGDGMLGGHCYAVETSPFPNPEVLIEPPQQFLEEGVVMTFERDALLTLLKTLIASNNGFFSLSCDAKSDDPDVASTVVCSGSKDNDIQVSQEFPNVKEQSMELWWRSFVVGIAPQLLVRYVSKLGASDRVSIAICPDSSKPEHNSFGPLMVGSDGDPGTLLIMPVYLSESFISHPNYGPEGPPPTEEEEQVEAAVA